MGRHKFIQGPKLAKLMQASKHLNLKLQYCFNVGLILQSINLN